MTIVSLPPADGFGPPRLRFCPARTVPELYEAVAVVCGGTDFRLVGPVGDLREDGSMDSVVASGVLTVHAVFRLRGGKGGFGALLKKSTGNGKKTTNFDECRDLQGRRCRHSRAVDKIKNWLEQKRCSDVLVRQLTDQGPAVKDVANNGIATDVKLDQEYMRQLKSAGRNKRSLVEVGLAAVEADAGSAVSSSAGASAASVPLEEKAKKPRIMNAAMDPLGLLSDASGSDSESAMAKGEE